MLAIAALLVTAWGALALWFQLSGGLAIAAIAAWCAAGLAGTVTLWRAGRVRHRRAVIASTMLAVFVMAGWWHGIAPSHDRQWADDVARLLESAVHGDQVTLRNVRNFDWRTETDYAPRWETRQYDLRQLQSADLYLSYWMGPHIAHTLVSFGFADGRKLAFSLEIRKERQESFSAIGGFFREFEEVMIASDERDIIRTRSNARHEQVYIYRVKASKAQLRAVFLAYLEEAAKLRHAPAFYNTLTSNCTTVVFDLARQIAPGLPMDYRLLASGHFAEYAYDQGALAPGYTYAQLQQRGHINARATQADADGADFSAAIRAGVPGISSPQSQGTP
nr:DUF4105 domain-containing protein [Pseudoduganella lurida]